MSVRKYPYKYKPTQVSQSTQRYSDAVHCWDIFLIGQFRLSFRWLIFQHDDETFDAALTSALFLVHEIGPTQFLIKVNILKQLQNGTSMDVGDMMFMSWRFHHFVSHVIFFLLSG